MFIIWHNNDYDLARWVYLNSDLQKMPEKTVLRAIPKNNSADILLRSFINHSDYHILPIIKYETPDIIIQKINKQNDDSTILFVTEFMTHTPQHHHPLQRFSRIYGASNLKIPTALIIPNTKVKLERKEGAYKPTSYKANPLIYHIFLKTTRVNKTPTLIYLWPDRDGYLKLDKKHPSAPVIEGQIEGWFYFLNLTTKKSKEEISDDSNIKKQLEWMVSRSGYKVIPHDEFIRKWQELYKLETIEIEETDQVIENFNLKKQNLSERFLSNSKTLIFEPKGLKAPATPFRTDPYAGMLCAFDNLFCRDKDGDRLLNLVFRAKNIKYRVGENKNVFKEIIHNKEHCPFLQKIDYDVAKEHLKENQCPFTQTKQQRIYSNVADIIVFDDYVYYNKIS